MNNPNLLLIKKVIGRVAVKNHMTPNGPLPVFDSTGDLVGFSLTCDKKMGNMDCIAQATFAVSSKANEATIQAKAEAAAAAIKNEILVTIRPKSVEKKVG